ncbi:MAG: UbiX family flavin prenyltransferase [Euryhalocaulis sp.]|uniref:UbiX family flavin prenyltransferase n=1 Tax=Euryhalocaulis sp. TaxID=2744307 RepID=UPI00182699E5|nr:UbiX family flavin prenyltransferase [Euryhalocaulis sp.]MBA4800311.1 UbiX family flavin prenyltransferase [Euryhalocaulis sp.]
MTRRLVVAITGASGAAFGVRALEALQGVDGVETHLVVSRAGALTAYSELGLELKDLKAKANVVYDNNDIGAAIASGSFVTDGMIIAPCSAKTLGALANGLCDNLVARAADVILKERRRLVMLFRETPLHLAHIRNMEAVTEMGAIVYPPVPALYARPDSIETMVDHTVGRVLDLFDIDADMVNRWSGVRGQ